MQEAGEKIIQESKLLRRKELLGDFHHEPHILLKSALKGEDTSKTIRNNTSLTVGETASKSESFNRAKFPSTENSDVLVFKRRIILDADIHILRTAMCFILNATK